MLFVELQSIIITTKGPHNLLKIVSKQKGNASSLEILNVLT